MSSYNGWTNHKTWNTALYFIQDGQFDDYLSDYVDDVYGLAQTIESEVREYVNNDLNGSGYVMDMIDAALGEVNWRELAETLLEDYEPETED